MLLTGGDAGLVMGVVAAPTGAAADGVVDDAVLELLVLVVLWAWCTGGRCVRDAAVRAGLGVEP
jgi:hypothetical protein